VAANNWGEIFDQQQILDFYVRQPWLVWHVQLGWYSPPRDNNVSSYLKRNWHSPHQLIAKNG
jgi:hypothetical protein